jgi:hypothetical protein
MVMVPGSVEDERKFSTLKYIRNPQRNRLQAQHLMCCARGFKSSAFSVEDFPYPEAILEWLAQRNAVELFRQRTQLEGQCWRQFSHYFCRPILLS